MRPLLLLSALFMAGGLLFTSAPARAEMGCACVKLGEVASCVSGINACMAKGGVCAFVCQYDEPKKKMSMRKAKKKG
ncbi:MAG: hypothetical protein JOZ70_12765 [Pseudolabrys sp.]|nr:hypothetical protein [Pseudolabrys sp.]MBV9956110.1 hypothetical protein [Pseudolabrys sp.]